MEGGNIGLSQRVDCNRQKIGSWEASTQDKEPESSEIIKKAVES
jgi:hypothetical protein